MAAPAGTQLILPETPSMKKAVSLVNEVDTGRFPRLLTRILQKLHLKTENSFSEEEEEKLQAAFSLEKQDLHLVLETISFILEQAVYHNVKPAVLQQQLENIHLSQDKAEAFASAWTSMGQDTVEKFRQRILAPQKVNMVINSVPIFKFLLCAKHCDGCSLEVVVVGNTNDALSQAAVEQKLETIGWQLNLQMAQSNQAKLKSPQAVLELGVSNEDSKNLEKVCVEFNHKELFEFYNKLETMQAQLDSLM